MYQLFIGYTICQTFRVCIVRIRPIVAFRYCFEATVDEYYYF
jgi:hypothetical protein